MNSAPAKSARESITISDPGDTLSHTPRFLIKFALLALMLLAAQLSYGDVIYGVTAKYPVGSSGSLVLVVGAVSMEILFPNFAGTADSGTGDLHFCLDSLGAPCSVTFVPNNDISDTVLFSLNHSGQVGTAAINFPLFSFANSRLVRFGVRHFHIPPPC